jgi:hypothetical protein
MKRLFFAALLACWGFAYAQVGPIAVPPQATITLSCTGSSLATALPTVGIGQMRQAEITNNGTANVFIEFGASTVAAVVASGYPYLPNQTKVQTIKAETTYVACIAASGTNTVYVTIGIGQ